MSGNNDVISIVKGEANPDLVSVYSIVRNEMFFLPAFLDHYRRIGIRQFIFLDDRSDDGTFEFLTNQPDCVLARSPLRYGDIVDGKRAVHVWKTEIPRRLLPGQWAICADADEFLFLPPRFSRVDEFVRVLEHRQVSAVAAVMVDFYPETVEQMEAPGTPQDRDELFASYPWFDAGPYFRWPAADRPPIMVHGGVQERLLRKFDISMRDRSKSGLKLLRHRIKSALFGKTYVKPISKRKVPLVKWSADRCYVNSHSLNDDPDWQNLLPLAHFKFTSALHRKIELALASRAYSDSSRAYFEYAELMAAMKAEDGSFLCPRSVKFTSVADFERSDLMKCDLVL